MFISKLTIMLELCLFLSVSYSYAEDYQIEISQIERWKSTAGQKGEIKLYVTATNNTGQPVTWLQKENFNIWEDEKPVQVLDFIGANTAQPITVSLVLDHSSSMTGYKLQSAKDAVITFIQMMKESDTACLTTFNNRVDKLQDPTSDKGLLAEKVDSIRASGQTNLYHGIYVGLQQLASTERRKAVVVLTDGINTTGSRRPEEVIQYAQEIQASIYTIGLGSGSQFSEEGINENVLQSLASETGGRYFYAPSADKLVDLYQLISMQLQYGYRVTYTSPRPIADGTTRQIRVTVNSNGTSMSAFGSYYVPGLIPGIGPINPLGTTRPSLLLFFSVLSSLMILAFLPGICKRFNRSAQRAAPPPVVIMQICPNPNCGQPIRASAKFCNWCGQRICPRCMASIRQTAKFCPKCGFDLR